jgi:hypothetical protein
MGRTVHLVSAGIAPVLSIVATVAMSQALLSHGEVRTIFAVPKENAGAFVAVLACVMFVPPLLGIVAVDLDLRRRELTPRLFPASMALLQAVSAWWLGEAAPRGWLLAAAAAFAIAALTAPKSADPTVPRAKRAWWRTSLGLAALLSGVAVIGARAAPFFNGADVSAAFGKDDISLLLGQVFFVPTGALIFLMADGSRLNRTASASAVRLICTACALIQLYALAAPFAAPLGSSAASAVLFAACALAVPGLFSARTAAPTRS